MFKLTVLIVFGFSTAMLTSCKQPSLYERLQNIQKAAWNEQQVPSFTFDITDTTAAYNVYVVLRHTNQYPYRNIWLNVGVQQPGDTLRHQPFELQLAAADKWLGTGMDDIYEHHALLFSKPVRFTKKWFGNIYPPADYAAESVTWCNAGGHKGGAGWEKF